MKLYMKQKVFSWKDKSTIKDENGIDKYFVEGEIFTLGKKLHITNAEGNEVAFVRQKVLSFMPRFFVEVNGEEVAEIVKKMTFLKPKYIVNGLGWEVKGEFMAHDYVVEKDGTPVVTIHKKWMTWGDTFELDVADGADEVCALAVVLAIDAVMDAQSAAGAGAASAGSANN
ncbi:MAG: LURP-one-related family protein [Clostridia bacterium]|nr:LURP-one-related family protein [Clostridia bacterium]